MSGTVVTFYSYKGGVGRSFALANIAIILAEWGHTVLTIDWDIEAPGLSHFFSGHVADDVSGVMGFLDDASRGTVADWSSYVSRVEIPECEGRLSIMPAARSTDGEYVNDVQRLDWDALYNERNFGRVLEEMRSRWVDNFDFVLVDSRTGVTDFSGVTTAQLPDVLAFFFVANRQSLEGACDIVDRAMKARRGMAVDRPALIPLPVPSKFERNEEYDRAQLWRVRFAETLASFFQVWTPIGTNIVDMVDLLTIPYVPRWSFGEEPAALVEKANSSGIRTSASPVTYALETVAAVISNRLTNVDLLTSSRDDFVLSARANATRENRIGPRRPRIFLSHDPGDDTIAKAVLRKLIELRVDVVREPAVSNRSEVSSSTLELLEGCDALILILSEHFDRSFYQAQEVQHFLRYSLRIGRIKPIITLHSGGPPPSHPELLNFRPYKIDARHPVGPQLVPVLERLLGSQL